MCTLLTVDRDFYLMNTQAVRQRILADSRMNPDGWALLAVDTDRIDTDFMISSMRINLILEQVDQFFSECGPYGRIFLHSRYATTDQVGVAFNHGFTDHQGVVIMHNGIIRNTKQLAVDSFNLVDSPLHTAQALLDSLEAGMEFFANIFLIRPEKGTYGVVRRMSGSLYTDGEGNFSTHPLKNTIEFMVDVDSAEEYRMAAPIVAKPTYTQSTYSTYDQEDSAFDYQKWLNGEDGITDYVPKRFRTPA